MADNLEKVEVIDIDTVNAIDSIKGLKDVIKTLREQLSECTLGSEEFKDTLETLTVAQDKLKNATKTSNETLEGSYDSLVKKMADLKKAWRATADEADRAVLAEHIADINEQLKEMDASIGNYQRNVGNYASAFDDLSIKIEGSCAKFEKINKASKSVIGSFDLVEGGLKMIGVESKTATALMNTMQGAMKMTNGLDSVKEGVKSFTTLSTVVKGATTAQWALNAAQMANPIGIIIGLVAALTAGIVGLVKWINKNQAEEERLRASFEATNKAIEDRNKAFDLEIRLMEARGEAQADILQKEQLMAEQNVRTTQLRIEALEKELKSLGIFGGKKKDLLKEQIEDLKEQLAEYQDNVRIAKENILVYNEEQKTEQKKKAEEVKEAAIKAEQEKVRKIREEEAKLAKLAEEMADKQIEEIERVAKAAIEAEQEKIKNAEADREKLLNLYYNYESKVEDRQRTAFEEERFALENKYTEDLNVIQAAFDAKLIEEEQFRRALLGLDQWYADEKKKIDKKENDANLKNKKDSLNAVYNATSSVLGSLAQMQDQNSKKGFETAKKLSIASAIMSTLEGVIGAWKSAMSLPTPFNMIIGAANSAAIAMTGAAQVAQIRNQKFGSTSFGSVGTGNSTPTVNTTALLSTPVNYTTEVQGAQAIDNAADTRVYVVESDITNTVNKVKVAEDESTY